MGKMIGFQNELIDLYHGELKTDYDIKRLTTWKIGGICKYVAFPDNESDLLIILKLLKKYNVKYYIIGKASNILFGDQYFSGMVIYLGKNFTRYDIKTENDIGIIKVLSGQSLNKIGKIAKENSLSGMEYLSFIPGSVGGALITNAEAHKKSIGDLVVEVKIVDNGEVKVITKEQCGFKYRSSIFEKNDFVIIEVTLQLKRDQQEAIDKRYKEAKLFRMEKQPKMPSAGSVFKNPDIGPAGLLIDQAGLKGLKVGGAVISMVHGNFILNEELATSADVIQLINIIRNKINDYYSVNLELEIKIFNN